MVFNVNSKFFITIGCYLCIYIDLVETCLIADFRKTSYRQTHKTTMNTTSQHAFKSNYNVCLIFSFILPNNAMQQLETTVCWLILLLCTHCSSKLYDSIWSFTL